MERKIPRPNRRGSNAIEFALTLPLFLMLIMGLAEYGILFSRQAALDNATAMACRMGSAIDPALGSPITEATNEWTTREQAVGLCAGATCTFTPTDLNALEYEVPNRTLRCEGRRTVSSFTGLVPYPTLIKSVSYYRFEWQRIP